MSHDVSEEQVINYLASLSLDGVEEVLGKADLLQRLQQRWSREQPIPGGPAFFGPGDETPDPQQYEFDVYLLGVQQVSGPNNTRDYRTVNGIKDIRKITGLGLRDSKMVWESLPKPGKGQPLLSGCGAVLLREAVTEDRALEIKETLERSGIIVEIR
jgi:ribosomal protein L7/L12